VREIPAHALAKLQGSIYKMQRARTLRGTTWCARDLANRIKSTVSRWNCPELLTVHLTIFLHYRQSKLCNHWQELIIMARNRAIKYAVWYKVSANVIVWNVRLTCHTFPSYFYRLWLSRITQWDVKVLQSRRRITATDLWSQERSVEWRSGDSNS